MSRRSILQPDDHSPVAVVMGAGGNAYDAVRSLARCDVPVELINSRRPTDGRYPGAFLQCPSVDEPDQLVSFLNDCVAPGRQVVLLPTSDAFSMFLARYRTELHGRLQYSQPKLTIMEDLCCKVNFARLCDEAGLPCPLTLVLDNEDDVEMALDRLVFPCVAKPPRSGRWSESNGGKGVYLQSKDDLWTVARDSWQQGVPVVVQDWIPGDADTLWFVAGFYDEASRPEKVFVGQKLLQFPLRIGTASLARLIWHEEVAQLANRFARAVGYSGLIDIEAKFDCRNGEYKIIEVNPRIGQFHGLGDDGRWNLPTYYFHRTLGTHGPLADYQPHEEGRLWVYPKQHLCSRVEELGLARGLSQGTWDCLRADRRCGWDPRDLKRCYRTARVTLGHARRLGLSTLIFGAG